MVPHSDGDASTRPQNKLKQHSLNRNDRVYRGPPSASGFGSRGPDLIENRTDQTDQVFAMDRQKQNRDSWSVVLFAAALPTLVTWIYFVVFEGKSAWAGGIGKALQFGFPAFWVFFVARMSLRESGLPTGDRPRWSRATSILFGLVAGLLIVAVTARLLRFLHFRPGLRRVDRRDSESRRQAVA